MCWWQTTRRQGQKLGDFWEDISFLLFSCFQSNCCEVCCQLINCHFFVIIYLFLLTSLKIRMAGASLVAQWLRVCLPMQGTQVRALVWEDPTCRGAAGPVSHNSWACASGACALQQERPRQWEARAPRWRVAPTHRQLEKAHTQKQRPNTAINKLIKKKSEWLTQKGRKLYGLKRTQSKRNSHCLWESKLQ